MDFYLIFKALHLIAVVAWFAGLFYMPRLFVYQAEHPEASPTLILMQHKLAKVIMAPAAVATLVFGTGLILATPGIFTQGWFHAKLALLVILYAFHGSLEYFRKRLATGTNTKSGKFFRYYNEIPTLILIAVIFLAVLKPF